MRTLFSLAFGIFISSSVLAQSWQPPSLPQVPQPTAMPRYDNFGGTLPSANNNPLVNSSTTSDETIRQYAAKGLYIPGGSTEDIRRVNQARIEADLANDPSINPSLRNGTKTQVTSEDQIFALLKDAGLTTDPAANIQKLASQYYKSPQFAKETRSFNSAFQKLNDMLSGKQPLSVAQAYFTVENAYGDNYLTQAEFDGIISKSADFIKKWMQQNGLNQNNSEDVHLAMQKFISQPLNLYQYATNDKKTAISTTTHKPFFYDYNDYQGVLDFKNYFLTKCLATGSGQCSSLPVVYLAIAEKLKVKAYLSTAPNHSFIKYPDNNGNIINYEPTSNWKLSDNWYRDNLFISAEQKRNHVYLDTFSSRQVVADCMLSLALGYAQRFGVADGQFMSNCIAATDKEFPYDNIQSRLVQSKLLANMLLTTMYHAGIRSFDQLDRSPQSQDIYMALTDNERRISALGYAPAPKELYNNMLKQQEFKGMVQDSLKIDGKKKRNLFIETK